MTSVPAILAFDTATSNCSIAITRGGWNDGQVVGSISFDSGVTHSRRLLGSIDWLLQTTEVRSAEIAAVALGTGPGSFTGLRIGMATAKGYAHGKGLPLIGISSLDGVAAAVRSEKLICVVMDARKKELYCCFYRCPSGGQAERCTEPVVIPPAKLVELIEEPVTMAGDGVRVYSDELSEMFAGSAEFLPWISSPRAENIGFLASDLLQKGDFLDLNQAAPEYVRSSDAQLSLVSPLRSKQTP